MMWDPQYFSHCIMTENCPAPLVQVQILSQGLGEAEGHALRWCRGGKSEVQVATGHVRLIAQTLGRDTVGALGKYHIASAEHLHSHEFTGLPHSIQRTGTESE